MERAQASRSEVSRSEERLRNDQDVARQQRDIGGDVAVLQKVIEPDAVFLGIAVVEPHQCRVVAVGELRQPAGRNNEDRKSTRLNSSHYCATRMPPAA